MKRILFFLLLASATIDCTMPPAEQSSSLELIVPALEIPDEIDDETQDLLDTTVAIEQPLYMRIIMTVGSETAAAAIRLQRAVVARCKELAHWVGAL